MYTTSEGKDINYISEWEHGADDCGDVGSLHGPDAKKERRECGEPPAESHSPLLLRTGHKQDCEQIRIYTCLPFSLM